MTEYKNSKSDAQLEELLLLTEQMQEELDQKDRTIEELKVQLDESLTLNERLNSENRAGNIQALKNDLRKTKELLQSEKEKTHAAEIMTEECQDKLRQAEQERDYALSHQKKVEIPVEKPVLYQKCGNCNQTAYLKAKEKYDTQREKPLALCQKIFPTDLAPPEAKPPVIQPVQIIGNQRVEGRIGRHTFFCAPVVREPEVKQGIF